MFLVNCSRCGPHMSVSDYMENGVCGPCLLSEITEELGLYERNDEWENGLSPAPD